MIIVSLSDSVKIFASRHESGNCEITVTKQLHYLTSTNRQQLHLMKTYNNYHCQAHLLADLLTIPLMYSLILWNNFLKKKKKKNLTELKILFPLDNFFLSNQEKKL